jgi:hypothetical protein
MNANYPSIPSEEARCELSESVAFEQKALPLLVAPSRTHSDGSATVNGMPSPPCNALPPSRSVDIVRTALSATTTINAGTTFLPDVTLNVSDGPRESAPSATNSADATPAGQPVVSTLPQRRTSSPLQLSFASRSYLRRELANAADFFSNPIPFARAGLDTDAAILRWLEEHNETDITAAARQWSEAFTRFGTSLCKFGLNAALQAMVCSDDARGLAVMVLRLACAASLALQHRFPEFQSASLTEQLEAMGAKAELPSILRDRLFLDPEAFAEFRWQLREIAISLIGEDPTGDQCTTAAMTRDQTGASSMRASGGRRPDKMEGPRMPTCCNCGALSFSYSPPRESLCGNCYEKWQAGRLPELTDAQLYPPDEPADPSPPLPSNAAELLDYCKEKQREFADWPDNDHPFTLSCLRELMVDAVKLRFRKLNLSPPQGDLRTVEYCRCWLDQAADLARTAANAQLSGVATLENGAAQRSFAADGERDPRALATAADDISNSPMSAVPTEALTQAELAKRSPARAPAVGPAQRELAKRAPTSIHAVMLARARLDDGAESEFTYTYVGHGPDFMGADEYFKIGYRKLSEVDFAPLLVGIEPILAQARQLADWAGERPLDNSGAVFLLQIGQKWLEFEPALNAIGIGASAKWILDEGADAAFAAAHSLHDLACAVRENNEWLRHADDICPDTLAHRYPEANMGMPHAIFAKRLTVAAELLRKAVSVRETHGGRGVAQLTVEFEAQEKRQADSQSATRKRMSRDEANEKAMMLAEADHEFVHKTLREWAAEIGCSDGLIPQLPFWQSVMKRTERGRKDKLRAPQVLSLTDKLAATTSDPNASDPTADTTAELERLISEQLEEDRPEHSPKLKDHERP